MIMNGKPIQFDFMTSYGKVSKTEADVCVLNWKNRITNLSLILHLLRLMIYEKCRI